MAAELAKQINPHGPEKTLIFCATDRRADEVAQLQKDAFREVCSKVDDGAVIKIIGASDLTRRPDAQQLACLETAA